MDSKYFNDDEFRCSCCGALPPQGIDPRLIAVLDRIRSVIGQPLYITSGYRCESHNKAVGGVTNSQHLYGTASDITCDSVNPSDGVALLADIARSAGASGIGLYVKQGFVHVDVRENTAEWSD